MSNGPDLSGPYWTPERRKAYEESLKRVNERASNAQGLMPNFAGMVFAFLILFALVIPFWH